MSGSVSVRPTTDSIASCNACLARNYDPKRGDGIGKRVDILYDIRISSGASGLTFRLCRDCLCKLVGEAFLACNPTSTKEAGET